MTDYPSLEDVLQIHFELIGRYGGAYGLRDRGALEAALARPQTGYYSDVIAEGAALMESLSQNHPFIDGNKRTAVTVTASFLQVNGYTLDVDDLATYRFLLGLYEWGTFRFAELEKWLREHARPESSQH